MMFFISYILRRKVFQQAYVSVGLCSLVFVFLLIYEVIYCYLKASKFWQKVACSLFTSVKYYRLCLWLDKRWIFTVARFSYCLVSWVSRKNFRRAFFLCQSRYVWSKYILSYDPYGLAHTIVKADVCRTERVDMSKWKSRPALHSHDFVVYVLGQSSAKMLISSSLLDKQIIIITS